MTNSFTGAMLVLLLASWASMIMKSAPVDAFAPIHVDVSGATNVWSLDKGLDRYNNRLQSSGNPNDLESPDERERRMELVRRLQKAFYQDESSVDLEDTDRGAGVVEDMPILRTERTELPGSQSVVHCDDPSYTHMFTRVLSGPEPWYFGHVHLSDPGFNSDNPEYRLGGSGLKSTSIGTLMRVSDYRRLEDGHLKLLVQAMGRFRVLEATQNRPYDVATVELLPDVELVESHLAGAMDMAVGGIDFCGAARAAAIAEDRHWQGFEFRRIYIDDGEDDDDWSSKVSPMANFDAGEIASVALNVEDVMEEYLLEPEIDESLFECPLLDPGSIESVFELEYNVWLGIDELIRLVTALGSNQKVTLPIPAQMLGLIPSKPPRRWPKGFALNRYALAVGLLSPKSPYVRADSAAPLYPDLRRVERLSFFVWLLLDSVSVDLNEDINRQTVLEMSSITERLEAAKEQITSVVLSLRQNMNKK